MIAGREDYERWAHEAVPVSIDRVTALMNHPGRGSVTMLVKWKPDVHRDLPRRRVLAAIIKDYVQEHAPVNVTVEGVRTFV